MTSWTVPARTEAVDNSRDAGMYWDDLNSASADDHTNDFFEFIDYGANANANAFVGEDFGSVATTIPGMAESIMFMGDHNLMFDGNLSSGVSSGDEFDFPSSSSHIGAASAASHEVDPKDLTLSAEDLLIHGTHNHHYSHSHGQSQHQHSQQRQQQQYQQQQQQQQQQHPLQHEHQHQFQLQQSNENQHQAFEYLGRGSMSEGDLSRLQGISLHSPERPPVPASDPSSPTPPNTDVRKPKKFVDALSATFKKAAKLRKNKRPAAIIMQPGSPSQEPPQILSVPKQRGREKVRSATQSNPPMSPPVQPQPQPQPQPQHDGQVNTQFVHGSYEDPFRDASLLPPHSLNVQYYGQIAPDTPPVESPRVRSDLGNGQFQVDPAWNQQQQQQQQQQLHWTGAGGEYITSQEAPWWTPNMMSQGSNDYTHHHQQHHQQQQQQQHHQQHRSASVHIMGHSQTSGMVYDYDPMPEPSNGGLMIHMPQPRASQSSVVMNDLTTNAQAFLPPPPIPQTALPMMSAAERSHRPPRAKSSGARHLSCSPVRKQRGPSASPTPGDQSRIPRSRHSSGASISSVRSASGRLPGSMPGTPCSIRKRRSRDVSGSSGGMSSLGGDSGVGFVNFTPSDGGVLMTGVAPSGSSKTKARREKEAQERRRRLSEAAIKAVAAAGGDVDKLLEQGFTF